MYLFNISSNFLPYFADPTKILSFTPGNTTLTVNTTLVLNCTFEGNPTPNTIIWSHNRSEVFPASDPNLSQTDINTYSLLEVKFININISGEYACGVNNSFGIDHTSFTFITVQGIFLLLFVLKDKCKTGYRASVHVNLFMHICMCLKNRRQMLV